MSPSRPIRFEQGRSMLLAGIRRRQPYAQAGQGIAQQWQEFKSLLPLPGQAGTTTYGAVCGHDEGGFEYLCAAEVNSFASLPANMGRMHIEAQQYAVFLHRGHISGIKGTWEAVFQWLDTNGQYQSAHRPDFEVYDQRYEAATGMGEVEIWVSVQPG